MVSALSRKVTLVATRLVTLVASASRTRSNAKFPESVCPSTLSVVLTPEIRRNGPAGRSRTIVWPPTLSCAVTGAAVVLTAMLNTPPKLTPGTVTRTVPLSWPATPAPVSSRAP